MKSTSETILLRRIIAIVRLDDLSKAAQLAQSLVRGGVTVVEFTLTNPEALQAIAESLGRLGHFPDVRIGVGSVRKVEQVEAAIEAGAQFVVSPILNEEVIRSCVRSDVPIISGAYTPTEIAKAWDAGASMVKVFPARALGPSYIRDVLAPMPDIQLVPTGGIDLANMQAYFDAGAVAVGVGGNLIDQRAIADCNWTRVESVAKQYAQAAAKLKDDHGN